MLKNNKYLIGLVIILLFIACQQNNKSRVDALPFYKEASFTPYWLKNGSKKEQMFYTIPNFKLTNQLGKTISQNTFKNKVYVTNFFFTRCPGICPKMTSNMLILQNTFKNNNEVLLLSHSVTPSKDSVQVLKKYAENMGIVHNKWHLVTGKRKEIYNLGRNAYFVEENFGIKKSKDDFLHTENFVLIDKNKHIRGIYNGLNKGAVNQLVEDIKTLLKE